jgi:phage tail sheath gpL-like
MTISFDSIPVDILTPGQYLEYNNTRAVQGAPSMPEVVLLIGQRLATGTVDEAVPTQVTTKEKGETYFEHGSQLAQMIEKFKATNPYAETWAIALDDAVAAVDATGTFTFAGTSTEAGNVYCYIGGERITVAIPSGTAHTAVGPLVNAAIIAHLTTSNMPVVPTVVTAVVTVTALHGGTNGNLIDLQLNYNPGETLPAGLTCTTVQMSAGATDPSLATAIAVFSDKLYTKIISALSDDTNMLLLEAELLTRWGPMVKQDGIAYIAADGNQGALTVLGNARNSQLSNLMGAGISPTVPWVWAAVTCAVDSAETDPARPRQTLLLPGVLPPKAADQFDREERDILLSDGVSTYTISQDGKCYIERLITTYQTNPLGTPDPSYFDLTTMHTLAYIRYTWQVRVATKFPRHKLMDDGADVPAGQPVVTPSILRAEAIALFKDTWVPKGVVEASSLEQFKTDAKFERDATHVNRVNMSMSPDLMNQFMVLAGKIPFLL